MWLWFGSLPLSWLFGIPIGGAFSPTLFSFPSPSLELVVAMLVVMAGMGLVSRSALNY
jgi:hypothetical protein